MKYPNLSFCKEHCDKGVYQEINTVYELRKRSTHQEDISDVSFAYLQIRKENCNGCLATLLLNWEPNTDSS